MGCSRWTPYSVQRVPAGCSCLVVARGCFGQALRGACVRARVHVHMRARSQRNDRWASIISLAGSMPEQVRRAIKTAASHAVFTRESQKKQAALSSASGLRIGARPLAPTVRAPQNRKAVHSSRCRCAGAPQYLWDLGGERCRRGAALSLESGLRQRRDRGASASGPRRGHGAHDSAIQKAPQGHEVVAVDARHVEAPST